MQFSCTNSIRSRLILVIKDSTASGNTTALCFGVLARFVLDAESRRYRIGGAKRDRTADPLRARQVLSQLSYSPSVSY